MARFQIEKGERFTLDKSEGLEKVQIDLNWKSGADLDASAFLVGADGMIMDDADFVFYNSNRRANPKKGEVELFNKAFHCLLYKYDAADDLLCVDLGGRRIIQTKN